MGIGIGLAAIVAAGTSGCGRATQLAQVVMDIAGDTRGYSLPDGKVLVMAELRHDSLQPK